MAKAERKAAAGSGAKVYIKMSNAEHHRIKVFCVVNRRKMQEWARETLLAAASKGKP